MSVEELIYAVCGSSAGTVLLVFVANLVINVYDVYKDARAKGYGKSEAINKAIRSITVKKSKDKTKK